MRVMTFLMMAFLMIGTATQAEELAVTVYNSNLGVISETRQLDFDKGVGKLAFRDVPAQIDAASVRFEVTGGGGEVSILEQNYAYDLVSPNQMYNRYLDQQIELIDKTGRLYAGKLLAQGDGAVTVQDDDGRIKVILLDHIAEVDFPSLPDGLITRPTLFWLYNSADAGQRECNVGYQTAGLNWSAEYVGLLSSNEKDLDLSGWASINNTSGKTYADAKLKLVAGDISRARPQRPPVMRKSMMALAEADAYGGFEEKAFFEYHLYTLPRKATLANREIKQVSLFEPASTGVEKIFTYRPDRHPTQVEVAIKFVNSKESGLGMPLPAGRVRLFKADDDGSVILLGEDQIKHTPRDEELTVKVGNAFDIVGEETMTDQRRISQKVEERDFKIELRNRKTDAATVRIEKQFYGFWEIMNSDLQYEKKSAEMVVFKAELAAGETRTITYRVRYTSR